ncbi:MAG: YgdI/YgdR family lipoprotein, partial [Pseudomonas sp.]|nr:YgdI/YgdR family lipoprotein [Pseudomonas sp.]
MQPRIIPALLLALGFTVLAGCANPSVITLND